MNAACHLDKGQMAPSYHAAQSHDTASHTMPDTGVFKITGAREEASLHESVPEGRCHC
jgi:hypothetical protein